MSAFKLTGRISLSKDVPQRGQSIDTFICFVITMPKKAVLKCAGLGCLVRLGQP